MRIRGYVRPFWFGVGFAICAALIVFQPLALTSNTLLFSEKPGEAIQGVIPDGLPRPQALMWGSMTMNILSFLGRFTPAAVLGFQISLFCILAYLLLSILNPTFRLTTGVDWDETILTRTYMHTAPLIKAFLIGVTTFLPAFAIWHMIGWATNSEFGFWLRIALSGATIWLLFSVNGVAADYESGNYEFPRKKRDLASLLIRGALAGTAVWLVTRFAPITTPEYLLEFFRSLGGIGQNAWWNIALIHCGIWAVIALGGGLLFSALGTYPLALSQRLKALIFPTTIFATTLWFGRVGLPNHLKNRYDFIANRSTNPVSDLAKKTNVEIIASGRMTIFAGEQNRLNAFPVFVQSFTGLDASPAAGNKIAKFLEQRSYMTALSGPAFYQLHDVASLEWDEVAGLQVDYLNLSRTHDPQYIGPFIEKLDTCRSTLQTQHYADLLADESVFAFPDRHALEKMGDIFARFGMRDKAAAWYRRAKLPESQVKDRLSARTMFVEGRVTGQLLLDGKPIANARIGIAPRNAMQTLQGYFQPNGSLRPFWLRWISASTRTDKDGKFALDHLVAGNYVLLFQSEGLRRRSVEPNIKFEHWPTEGLFVGFGTPNVELGKVELKGR